MRAFYVVLGVVIVLLGAWAIVYPLSNGRGVTNGAVLGAVLVAVGTYRVVREWRERG